MSATTWNKKNITIVLKNNINIYIFFKSLGRRKKGSKPPKIYFNATYYLLRAFILNEKTKSCELLL